MAQLRNNFRSMQSAFNRLHGRQSLVQLSTSASATNVDNVAGDMRPYAEMPGETAFSFLRKVAFGKYRKNDFLNIMYDLCEEHGIIYRLPGMFGKPAAVITTNPKDFEHIYRNESKWPLRPGSDAMHYHRTKHRPDFFKGVVGLISSQNEEWGNFRTAVNPVLMQPRTTRLYYQKMSNINKQFVERIREIRDSQSMEVPADFEDEINRWTLESVAVVALDRELGLITTNRDDAKAKQLFDALNGFFQYGAEIEMKPSLWRYVHTPTFKKYLQSLDTIIDTASGYVQESIERLAKNPSPSTESDQSVLEKLQKIDPLIAKVMATDMLMAGVDTTTSAFTAVLLCLAKNPAKQARLREEIRTLLPTKQADFTLESLDNLHYLRACIKESLRVHPITLGNARITPCELTLSGYQVPKGTQVFMLASKLFRNEQYYPQCREFVPERFLRDSKEFPLAINTSNPFVNLPFGFGTRMCIGKRIVQMELELGIARVIRNFHVEFNYPTAHAFKNQLISVPNIPLKFKFTDVVD